METSLKTSFVQKLRDQKPLIGTLVSMPLPDIAEMLSSVGFDWLFIDMEHSTLPLSVIQHMLQAIRGNCSGLIRIAENNPVHIKQVLDLGADGIIVPFVNSAQEARQAVAAAKYPPLGSRSVGIGRAHQYGFQFADYVREANESTAVIIQIEHIRGVENLEEILSVEGIDGVFIGPYDLSGSLDKLGAVQDPVVQQAIHYVKTTCLQKQMPIGIFTLQPDAIESELASGTQFIAAGTDASFIWKSGQSLVEQFRKGKGRVIE